MIFIQKFLQLKKFFQLYLNLSQGKRPVIEQGKISKSMEELINKCWSGNPTEIPEFEEIKKELLEKQKE